MPRFKLEWFAYFLGADLARVQGDVLSSIVNSTIKYYEDKLDEIAVGEHHCRAVVYFLWAVRKHHQDTFSAGEIAQSTTAPPTEENPSRPPGVDKTVESVGVDEEQAAVQFLHNFAIKSKDTPEQGTTKNNAGYYYSTSTAVVDPKLTMIETLKRIGTILNERLYYSEWHDLKPLVQTLASCDQSLADTKQEGLKWLKKYDTRHSCLVRRSGVDLDSVIKKVVKHVQQDCQGDDSLMQACQFFVRFYRTAYLCKVCGLEGPECEGHVAP